MSEAFDTSIIEHRGRRFRVSHYYDTDYGRPWEESEGHGPVREIQHRDQKKPGERLMTTGHVGAYIWAYDWAGAIKLAHSDGWGLADDKLAALQAKLGREPTRKEIVAAAVQSDFEFLKGWVKDRWYYVGVGVQMLGADDVPLQKKYAHAVWGIESNSDEYLDVVALELADEAFEARRDLWLLQLRQARVKHRLAMRRALKAQTSYFERDAAGNWGGLIKMVPNPATVEIVNLAMASYGYLIGHGERLTAVEFAERIAKVYDCVDEPRNKAVYDALKTLM